MEKLKKEDFEKWVKENKWLKISEAPNPNGRQDSFLTPAGNIIIAIHDLSGNLFQIAILGPAPAPQNPLGFSRPPPFISKG